MNGDAILALIGGVLVAFVVRVANVLTQWLSKLLGVNPPDPIPPVDEIVDRARGRSTSTSSSSPAQIAPTAPVELDDPDTASSS